MRTLVRRGPGAENVAAFHGLGQHSVVGRVPGAVPDVRRRGVAPILAARRLLPSEPPSTA